MYGIENMHISVMSDELGLFPVVHDRVTPAWMAAERYENCESNLPLSVQALLQSYQRLSQLPSGALAGIFYPQAAAHAQRPVFSALTLARRSAMLKSIRGPLRRGPYIIYHAPPKRKKNFTPQAEGAYL